MRLVIVSNRLPITIDKQEGGLIYYPSAGGLATGLNSLDDSIQKIWIGWPGKAINNPKEQDLIREELLTDGLVPIFLSEKEIITYYEGFSNKSIWPHFHYFTQYTTYDEHCWEAYQAVNQKFATEVCLHLRDDDLVWIHDYQLMLLPALIRNAFPKISIGFFLHIPFPSYEVFRMLPWRKEILKGILGANQIGFHTFGYMRHFLSASYRILGQEHHFGKLTTGNRLVSVDVFPMGIDYQKYAEPALNIYKDDGSFKIKRLAKEGKVLISIDRLDYTKGIPQRIKAFEKFISDYSEYQGKVSFVLIVVPSRSRVDQYQELKNTVDTLVGEINGLYGTFDWTPIRYFYRSLNFAELTTLYQVADIAMITPLRDGMNLVAKEFVASKEKSKKGVLILSEMAGAANELTEALIVNPQDLNDIVQALRIALEMNEKEQRWRLESMQAKLKEYSVSRWASSFIDEQINLMAKQEHQYTKRLGKEERTKLLQAYQQAEKRLLVLDYDGTLMGFQLDPQAVVPDERLLEVLKSLADDEGNKLVINSGRDRKTMQKWLGPLGIDMAAEHGVWVKKGERWRKNRGLTAAWKEEIRPVLDNLVQRTPGTFVEEKDFSIAWHYRRIDKDLGEKRVREFRDVLLYLTANLDLQVLEGNKVVEIKNSGVNKGMATLNWLNEKKWDFIMAIGDDHTDEDTFKVMPAQAYTIKVGLQQTEARYNLISVQEVRSFLEAMAEMSTGH